MPLRKLFWVLSGTTVAFLALQVLGYAVLDAIIALLIMDAIVVELGRQEDRRAVESQLKPELIARVGNVEKLCSNMLSSINTLPTMEHFYQIAEQKMGEHGTRLREEIKDDLDRLAKKAIDIENRLFDMKRNLASGIGGIDDRLRAIETGKWTIESADESGDDTETEDEKQESPVLEEVAYGKGAATME